MRGRFLLLLVICGRSGRWGSVQRRAHPAQLGAHSAAQSAGSAAGKAAFQRLQKGVSAEHLLGRLRVAQGRVNGLVRIGLHKCLHGVVDAAGHCIRHRRVLLRQYAVVCHAAHHVRQLARQRVLGVVASHGPGKVCRAHAVDGPPRTELCKAAHQRLACALALLDALAHALRAALGAQHRQHQRRADARHRKVLRRTGGHPHQLARNGAHARLRRFVQLLAALVHLVAQALLRVDALAHLCPADPRPHPVDLALAVALGLQLFVRVGHAGALGRGRHHPAAVQLHGVVPPCILGLSAGHQAQQFPLPVVALHALLQLVPVLSGLHCVLHAPHGRLARYQRGRRHRVHNAADRVGDAPRRPLPVRQGIKVGNVLPRLSDLLAAVALGQQLRVGVLPLFRARFRRRRTGHCPAHAYRLHGVVSFSIGLVPLAGA